VFTGAGISCSAGIPDIRGDNGLATKQTPLVCLGMKERALDTTIPAFAHCALAALMQAGRVKFIATSNVQ